MPLPPLQPPAPGSDQALVVGGTGMLAGVTRALAEAGWHVTVIARRPGTILDDTPPQAASRITPIPADWTEPEAFARQLRILPDPALAILWMHTSGEAARDHLAAWLSERPASVRVLELLGTSDLAHTNRPAVRASPGTPHESIRLGYQLDAADPRWLTHAEIVASVLHAIDHPADQHIVGRTDPSRAPKP